MVDSGSWHYLLAGQVLLALLIVISVVAVMYRKRYLLALKKLLKKDADIKKLRQQLITGGAEKQKSTKADVEGAQAVIKELELLVAHSKHRIANLEKFKTLYFELEAKLKANGGAPEERVMELEKVIMDHGRLVDDLKERLSYLTDKYQLQKEVSDGLNNTIEELESTTVKLNGELLQAKSRNLLLDSRDQEVANYRERVEELELVEIRLKSKLADTEDKLGQVVAGNRTSSEDLSVRKQVVDDMRSDLHSKESEIKRLREECETIGRQYEALATKSLSASLENSADTLSPEQIIKMEELQKALKENAAALERKQAECEMLENFYLELQESAGQQQAEEELEVGLASLDKVKDSMLSINEEIESIAGNDYVKELAELRVLLSEKEAELRNVRQDYLELKEQFVEIAQEEILLKKQFHETKEENQQLKMELKNMKNDAEGLVEIKHNFSELQAEYNKLESRYLSIMEKYSA